MEYRDLSQAALLKYKYSLNLRILSTKAPQFDIWSRRHGKSLCGRTPPYSRKIIQFRRSGDQSRQER
jgi:hypothetical protein